MFIILQYQARAASHLRPAMNRIIAAHKCISWMIVTALVSRSVLLLTDYRDCVADPKSRCSPWARPPIECGRNSNGISDRVKRRTWHYIHPRCAFSRIAGTSLSRTYVDTAREQAAEITARTERTVYE